MSQAISTPSVLPCSRPLRRHISVTGCLCFVAMPGVLLFSNASLTLGQDLGALARQERERKAGQAKGSQHVYTNEDLARSRILTREDQQRFALARQNGSLLPKDEKRIEAASEQPVSKEGSLGEIAKQYRQRKLEPEAETASKFPLPMDLAPLAAPNPPGFLTNQPPKSGAAAIRGKIPGVKHLAPTDATLPIRILPTPTLHKYKAPVSAPRGSLHSTLSAHVGRTNEPLAVSV